MPKIATLQASSKTSCPVDVATALEPARRHASVEALADDVRRFLADAWLSRFNDELLEIPTLTAVVAEALLIDGSGAVVVRSVARRRRVQLNLEPQA